jgi:DMSO/TMAO reductase YedYZ molybdopterin-dependent catalytic subunit
VDKDSRLVPYGATNLGTPLQLVDGLIVPTSLFFVRSNYSVPTIDRDAWRLRLSGLVDRPLEASLDELVAMPQRTITAFMECSGNSRTRFAPPAEGTPWLDDAVGNAEWQGVPLRYLLDLAGLRAGAEEVVSQGADDPVMQRGLPLRAALDPDTLVAWRMNGAELLPAHGGPVRLFVPGWGGIASTKWLVGLDAIGHRFDGFWNAENYVLISPSGEETGRVEEMPVKSVIVRPGAGATVEAGPVTISGFAWSGFGGIERIEVSVDGGQRFRPAAITHEAGPRSWVRWEHLWEALPGPARLRARATDETGRTQPETAAWNAKGYQMNAIAEVPLTVIAPST